MGIVADYATKETDTRPMYSPTRAAIAVCVAGFCLFGVGGGFLLANWYVFSTFPELRGAHMFWGEVFLCLLFLICLSFLVAGGLVLYRGISRLMALTYP